MIRPIHRSSGLLGGVIIALLTAACAAEEEPVMTAFRLVPISTHDIVVSAFAAGTVEPIQPIEVKSKASGEIIEVAVEVGDEVVRGDLLVRVDQRVPNNAVIQAEADLRVANAELANAQSQWERSETLHESQVISLEEWEAARLAFATAEARQIRAERTVEDARIAFEDTEVRAPSAGMILSRQIEPGNVIQSASFGMSGGSVLLTMADLGTVQVRSFVDETDIGKISEGMRVTITVEAFPNQPFDGEVLKIEPQALLQQNVTMFPVLVRIENERGLLKPGMNAEVQVHIAEQHDVLAIPNTALRTERDVELAAEVLGLDIGTLERQLAMGSADEEPGTAAGEGPTELAEGGGARAGAGRDRSPQARETRGGHPAGARGHASESGFQFGGSYIVFVKSVAGPRAVRVRTGVTDLEYSTVIAGLTAGDSIYILPSATLVESQRERQERVQQRTQLLGQNN